MNLQLVRVDPDPDDMRSVYTATHSKEISLIRWITDASLLTVGLDRIVKLWHFKNEKLFIILSSETSIFYGNMSSKSKSDK
jgi:hypothetical protein